jgi:hypothetical protein
MPKPTPGPTPDPMAGVVDRLLAQLPGLQGHPESQRMPPRTGVPVTVVGGAGARRETGPLAVWTRVLLGLTLAVTMGWWPYSRDCGLPLFSYLGAVIVVLFAGLWSATASWKARSALGHIISLTVILYGALLTVSELLPRTGYAVQRATWSCDDHAEAPSIVLGRTPALP